MFGVRSASISPPFRFDSHHTTDTTAIKRGHVPNVGAAVAISEISEISVAARRGRYSRFPARTTPAVRRYTCAGAGVTDLRRRKECSARARARAPYQKVIKAHVQIPRRFAANTATMLARSTLSWRADSLSILAYLFVSSLTLTHSLSLFASATFTCLSFIRIYRSNETNGSGRLAIAASNTR